MSSSLSSSIDTIISFNDLPPEIIIIIFNAIHSSALGRLDWKTFMIIIPQVCKLWKELCRELTNVRLDFTTLNNRFTSDKGIPVDSFTKILNTFSNIKSVRYYSDYVIDEHLFMISKMCPGLTNVDFGGSLSKLTDAAVIALAHKCHGLTDVSFYNCDNLTNTSLIVLADKCRGLKKVTFWDYHNLTDAAVLELADKCRGLTHVSFTRCFDELTDIAVIELADKCPELTDVWFYNCDNLTYKAVIALADKCEGLKKVNFSGSENITEEDILNLVNEYNGLEYIN